MQELPLPLPGRLQETLRELLLEHSPVGATDGMLRLLQNKLAPWPVRQSVTARGNLIVSLGEGDPKRAIAAHMDTLGAMVQYILPSGRLELTPLGSWSARFAEGARATIWCDNGERIRGTVLHKYASGHAWSEAVDTQPVNWEQVEFRPDIVTHSAEDSRGAGISPGQIVALDVDPEFTETGFLVSRYLDNKVAIACALECLSLLHENGLAPIVPFCFAFTNAEEVGHGAGTSLSRSVDDLISVDIAPVAANQHSSEFHATLGYKDAAGPHSQSLLAELETLAQIHEVPYVRDVFRHYHSDGSSVKNAGYDTRTALLGFGTDSTHGYERTHMTSVMAVTRLMLAWMLRR